MITGIRTHITIGGLNILRTPHVWVEYKRHSPLSGAMLVLPDPNGEVGKKIGSDDPVMIKLGYRDQEPATWQGKLQNSYYLNKDQIGIWAAGNEYPLVAAKLTESFENETPEAIVRYAVNKSGLPLGQINSPGVIFPHFAASNIPVYQAARQAEHTCQKAFGLKMSGWALWMDKDGKINWGDFDEAADIPAIATGNGLINHLPAGGHSSLNTVETFLLPGLRASQKFKLTDTKRGVNGEFRALAVRHEITPDSARTYIQYGTEYSQF